MLPSILANQIHKATRRLLISAYSQDGSFIVDASDLLMAQMQRQRFAVDPNEVALVDEARTSITLIR